MKIYHNPRCSKSRETLRIITDAGIEPEIVEYLKNPPSREEMNSMLAMLDMKPEEILRKNEAIYKEKFKGKKCSDAEWVEILIENPKLIERPIVVVGDQAVLGRPPENVKRLF